MKSLLLGLTLATMGHSLAIGQCELEAIPIHAEHWSYLREYTLGEIELTQFNEDASRAGLTYGAVFHITGISKEQIQVQLLPSGKSGKLKDSVYLALYECEGNTMHQVYHRVDKVRKPSNGQPLRLIAQALNISSEAEYYALIAGTKDKKAFTIRTTQDFRINRFRSVDLAEGEMKSGNRVIGRVTDENGNAVSGEKVHLYDEDNVEIQETTTDERGEFRFEKLPAERSFMAKLDESASDLKLDMYLFDEAGEREGHAESIGHNTFSFTNHENPFNELKLLTKVDYAIYPGENKIGIAGRVVDQETFLYGVDRAEIILLDKHNQELNTTLTDKTGHFYFNHLENGNYTVRIQDVRTDQYTEIVLVDDKNIPLETTSSEFMSSDGVFKFKKLPSDRVDMQRMIEADFEADETDFTKLLSDQNVILKHVYFESGQADLLPSSYRELDELCAFLTTQKELKVQISGHTDNTGGNEVNLKLSEDRAESVYTYLRKCDIDASRLTFVGYGKSKHIVSNVSEEGRKRNRRVEIEVRK